MGKELQIFLGGPQDESKMCGILATAAIAGVKVTVGQANTKEPDYKHNVHPTGLSPAIQTTCGRYAAGTLAIFNYLAEQGDISFCGRTKYEKAVIESFLQLSETQLTTLEPNKAAPILADLNKWLETRTFLVSERVTVADIAVAFALLNTYKQVSNKAPYVDLNRWLDTILNQPTVAPFSSGKYVAPAANNAAAQKGGKGQGKGQGNRKDKKGDKEGAKKEKKKEEPKKKEEAPVNGGLFDLRVGHVKSAKKLENSESLYVEMIDVGEEEPRQICSGLVKHMPPTDIEGKKVIVMCNLKPAKLAGTFSYGMVMCSTGPDGKVALCQTPEGSVAGDKIIMEKYETGLPKDKVSSKKLPELLAEFKTDDKGVVLWKDAPLVVTGKGSCSSPNHPNCPVK